MSSVKPHPTKLSTSLNVLFPQGVLVAELRVPGDPTALHSQERWHVRNAFQKRTKEFAGGRLCARFLLDQLGIQSSPIGVGANREPLWPHTVTGSITHTTGFCAAVLARKASVRALGIDTELAGSVTGDLWRGICTPAEIAWLARLPESEQVAAATLVFSAKEAFYKCQFPVTQVCLGFHDVAVECLTGISGRGDFRVHANRSLGLDRYALPRLGQYLFHEQFITTGMALLLS